MSLPIHCTGSKFRVIWPTILIIQGVTSTPLQKICLGKTPRRTRVNKIQNSLVGINKNCYITVSPYVWVRKKKHDQHLDVPSAKDDVCKFFFFKWGFPCCIYSPTLVEIHQSMWKIQSNVNLSCLFSQLQQKTTDNNSGQSDLYVSFLLRQATQKIWWDVIMKFNKKTI